MPHTSTYKDFWVVTLDQKGHDKTCNYWYLVQTYGGTAHTAFTHRHSLIKWLDDRGLKLTQELAEHGTTSCQRAAGVYKDTMHLSYDDFHAIQGNRTRVMSNGDWTLGIIRDEEGIKNIHHLNPNCKDRQVFDYTESRLLVG